MDLGPSPSTLHEESAGGPPAVASSSHDEDSHDSELEEVTVRPAPAPRPGITLPLLKLPQVAEEPVSFWLRRKDQLVAAGFVSVIFVLLVLHWIKLSRWGAEPIEIERLPERRAEYRIDINLANRYEWEALDGIGPALASRIVADREKNGPFRKVEDLRRVPGIGPRLIEKLTPQLEVSDEFASPDRGIKRPANP